MIVGAGTAFHGATQFLSRARQPRHHSTHRDIELVGDLAIVKSLKADKQQNLTMLDIERRHCRDKIAKLPTVSRRNTQGKIVAQIRNVLLSSPAPPPPQFIDVQIVQNRPEPSQKPLLVLECIGAPKSPLDAVLNEIV